MTLYTHSGPPHGYVVGGQAMTNQPEALRVDLLRDQHAEIERLRAEVWRLEAELLTKQRGQYVDGLFGRGGRS